MLHNDDPEIDLPGTETSEDLPKEPDKDYSKRVAEVFKNLVCSSLAAFFVPIVTESLLDYLFRRRK